MIPSLLKAYSLTGLFLLACIHAGARQEWAIRQLTHDLYNHELDHNQNFSPDDHWIVYDTRPNPSGIAQNQRIEQVNVTTGQIQCLYQVPEATSYGPGLGAVSYHPRENKVVFIHGLPHADSLKPYAGHRRLGKIVDEDGSYWMDSRDVTEPFTPGALRGGTHRHHWSGDGNWVGFTYNDAIMVDLEAKTGKVRDLRTLGVAKRLGPTVRVDPGDPGENVQGNWFSVVLVEVVPDPKPGSGEISRAYSDWWVGTSGYLKEDGTRQLARAFLGDMVGSNGKKFTEVFLVDIPEAIDNPGEKGPLEGTAGKMPAPPKGATVQRLTHTEDRKFPGVAGSPRHWVSSSMDGAYVSYLAKDEDGIVQVFVVPTVGGHPAQVTHHRSSVQSMVRWHPFRREFVYVCEKGLFIGELDAAGKPGVPKKISPAFEPAPFSPVYSRDGNRLAFNRYVEGYIQVFLADRP
ncbi:DUF3748 domain-containing protein [Cyclobacterium xiamenense]|uniref:DUF3748 domain-containing protein n=1 Tax=Cyclobacterium xiamenense TaxID=1297121 RepID=UPI0012B78F77|nr:DUF3748 domain-containing protein [Cyclobacterium xiamenense]